MSICLFVQLSVYLSTTRSINLPMSLLYLLKPTQAYLLNQRITSYHHGGHKNASSACAKEYTACYIHSQIFTNCYCLVNSFSVYTSHVIDDSCLTSRSYPEFFVPMKTLSKLLSVECLFRRFIILFDYVLKSPYQLFNRAARGGYGFATRLMKGFLLSCDTTVLCRVLLSWHAFLW